jgi:hypothetical protein
MKKTTLLLLTISAIAASPVSAGVVMEMATKDSSGQEMTDNTISAQSELIRLDNVGGATGHMSMIFRGNELMMLNHDEKEYYVIDEATLQQMNSQMSEAMKMMEEQLANVPPEQRAMVEKMMRGKMQGMGMDTGSQTANPPAPPRVEAAGSGNWEGYPCVKYVVHEGAEKTQEIWATPMNRIEGADEMTAAFRKMSEFMQKMTETFKAGPFAQVGQTPMGLMQEIEGFPVHSKHFSDGELERETFLKSATMKSLEPSLFEVPSGYKRQDLMRGRR